VKPKHRCENNIKTNVKKIYFGGVECIHLCQDRVLQGGILYIVMKFRVE
jgi:hypothetical protein